MKNKIESFIIALISFSIFNSCEKESVIPPPPNPYTYAYDNAQYTLGGQNDALTGATHSVQYSRFYYRYEKSGEDRYKVYIHHHFYAPVVRHFYDTLYVEISPEGIIEYDKKFENPCYILKTNSPIGFKDERITHSYYGEDTETRQLTDTGVFVVTNAGNFNCFEITYRYSRNDGVYKYYIHQQKGITKVTFNSSLYRCFWILSAEN